jgi:hypothetical protein
MKYACGALVEVHERKTAELGENKFVRATLVTVVYKACSKKDRTFALKTLFYKF